MLAIGLHSANLSSFPIGHKHTFATYQTDSNRQHGHDISPWRILHLSVLQTSCTSLAYESNFDKTTVFDIMSPLQALSYILLPVHEIVIEMLKNVESHA